MRVAPDGLPADCPESKFGAVATAAAKDLHGLGVVCAVAGLIEPLDLRYRRQTDAQSNFALRTGQHLEVLIGMGGFLCYIC